MFVFALTYIPDEKDQSWHQGYTEYCCQRTEEDQLSCSPQLWKWDHDICQIWFVLLGFPTWVGSPTISHTHTNLHTFCVGDVWRHLLLCDGVSCPGPDPAESSSVPGEEKQKKKSIKGFFRRISAALSKAFCCSCMTHQSRQPPASRHDFGDRGPIPSTTTVAISHSESSVMHINTFCINKYNLKNSVFVCKGGPFIKMKETAGGRTRRRMDDEWHNDLASAPSQVRQKV